MCRKWRAPLATRGAPYPADCVGSSPWCPGMGQPMVAREAHVFNRIADRAGRPCLAVNRPLSRAACQLQRSGPGSGGVTGKGFQPGQTGNPGGRAKPGTLDIAALARSKAPQAIAALERALDDPKHYVAAAIALLDRGFGRPAQAITATDNTQSITFQHLVAARAFSDELARERAAAENAPTISGRAEPRLSIEEMLSRPALE
jgi:hypothetical protein